MTLREFHEQAQSLGESPACTPRGAGFEGRTQRFSGKCPYRGRLYLASLEQNGNAGRKLHAVALPVGRTSPARLDACVDFIATQDKKRLLSGVFAILTA